jgi:hypothetical protein
MTQVTCGVRVQHTGRREMFSLGTANRAAAAARARDIYLHLAANGWETTLTKFKPKSGQAVGRIVKVGDFIREVKANCPKRGRTLDDYVRCFRQSVQNKVRFGGCLRGMETESAKLRHLNQFVTVTKPILIQPTPKLGGKAHEPGLSSLQFAGDAQGKWRKEN